MCRERLEYSPTATEVLSESDAEATFRHFSRYKEPPLAGTLLKSRLQGMNVLGERVINRLQHVLIDPIVAQRFQALPVKSRLPRAWAAAEDNDIYGILLLYQDRSWLLVNLVFQLGEG